MCARRPSSISRNQASNGAGWNRAWLIWINSRRPSDPDVCQGRRLRRGKPVSNRSPKDGIVRRICIDGASLPAFVCEIESVGRRYI
jgi:hypothetical protein